MGRNILVVEDDHNISDLIHMYLVKEGFDVRIAGDGGRAIEEFNKQIPDLILLDIMLPVMDGWAVCAKIRETSKVPIIMLTAKGEVMDRTRYGLRGEEQADTLVRRISARQGNVTVWLGTTASSGGLRAFLRGVEQAEGSCRALTETA